MIDPGDPIGIDAIVRQHAVKIVADFGAEGRFACRYACVTSRPPPP